MKIFNETKTVELQNPDSALGYIVDDKIQTGQTVAVPEVQEQGHYEVEREYPNGGKDMRWVVDVAYVAPKTSEPIFEDIKIYIPFSAEELKEKKEQKFYEKNKAKIDELNKALEYLNATDYKAIQFAEGVLAAAQFEPIKQQRIEARNNVRELKVFLANKRLKAGLE